MDTLELVVSGHGALMRRSGQQTGCPETEEVGEAPVSWRAGKGPGLVGQVGGMLSTDLVSVWPPPAELLTLVSQKMCMVVYPKVEEDSGTEELNEDVEQWRQPIYQPAAPKDKAAEEP